MLKMTLVLGLFLFVFSTLTSQATELKLAFVGDIMVARHVGRNILRYGTEYPFKDVAPVLKSADMAFGNFEGTFSGNKITGSNKNLVFRAPATFASALVSGGIDIVSLANNHMLDAGRAGVLSTIDNLESRGIKTIGAGRTNNEAYACRIIESKGVKVGFLAFTDIANSGLANAIATSYRAGVATASNLAHLRNLITSAKSRCDILVVSFHFGNEYQTKPNARQKLLAKSAINSGADIIIGHHPHVLQPVVQIKGKTVAYSLGNFVFDNHKPSRARTGILIIKYDINTGFQKSQLTPCYIRKCQPQIL